MTDQQRRNCHVREPRIAAARPRAPSTGPLPRPLEHEGHFVGSDEESIGGETTFRWLPGGFFLEQSIELDFGGLKIESLELIGYDPESDRFPSTVFSNLSPVPLPYSWDVREESVTITVSYPPLDATFTGSWREDGTFSGGLTRAPTRR